VGGTAAISGETAGQDELYGIAAENYGPAIERLSRAYEADPDSRRDLLQDIHLQLWRSFAGFDRLCSLRTWVYRVAHNVATAHVVRQRRLREKLVSIEEIESMPRADSTESIVGEKHALDRLSTLIHSLRPLDRQLIVFWLEGLDANSMAEITGLSPANVAMKLHRIRNVLTRKFHEGGSHGK
jgi:RNA polymerase sigma-70 factor (ECF subfamily)